MSHKAGFVSIIGKPNVGKSTLMNTLVGEKLSIITSKAQTTRHRIMGIVSGEDYQIVYSDTPGILKPAYALHESMMKFVEIALNDADVFLVMTEHNDKLEETPYIEKIKKMDLPIVVCLNKIDLISQKELEDDVDKWHEIFPNAEIIPISALHKFNLEKVFPLIIKHLPESPEYFPKEELTDKPMRFFMSEIIREQILLNYKKEVPYSVEVAIDSFKEQENLVRIRAILYVSRESQKAILLGHKGIRMKNIGIEARKNMEDFLGKKVFLETHIKVQKDWRDKDSELKKFGYEN